MSQAVAERLRAFLKAHGECDPVEACKAAFALDAGPDLARRLLETALPGELQFEGRAVRWLRPATTAADTLAETTFLVVDLETTGVHPASAEIIEFGAVYVRNGKVLGEEHTLVRPRRTIPPFITGLTGIDNAMVADAPPFDEVAERLHRLFQGVVGVAHNAKFDFGFLDTAFRARGMAPVGAGHELCTVKLGRSFAPGPRYNLDALAARLKIPTSDRHRALGDARVTADVLVELLRRAESAGISSVDGLRAYRKPKGQGAALRFKVGPERIRALPENPGIYRFRNEKGEVIYVGKALNLRKRLGSYFIGTKKGKTSRMLLEVRDFDYTVVGSELEALLEEAREIRLRQPEYNHALRTWGRYGYLHLDRNDPFPRLRFSKEGRDREQRESYGPFRFALGGRLEVKALRETFRLRNCRGMLTPQAAFSPCIEHGMRRCGGPCALLETEAEYGERVASLRAFLGGERRLLTELRAEIILAAERQQYERAAALRDRYQVLRGVHQTIRREGELAAQGDVVFVLPAAEDDFVRLFLIRQGHGVESLRVHRAISPEAGEWTQAVATLLTRKGAGGPGEMQDARIAEAWVRRKRDVVTTRVADHPDAGALARALLAQLQPL